MKSRIIALVTIAGMMLLAFFATNGSVQAIIAPGTNGKIAVNRDFVDAFSINPDGSQEHQIGPAGSTRCTTWSPNGSKILCNVFGDNVRQPATANPDGSDFTLLNPNLPLDLFCIFWSPDGNRLLCHSEGILNPADAGLYTVRSSDASDLVRLTANGSDNGYGYSPDGSHILFARFNPDGTNTLFSVKPDGNGKRQLSPPNLSVIDLSFFDQVGADWSPTANDMKSEYALISALELVEADDEPER